MTTKLMAGIDLHGNNLFCAIVDMNGKRVFEKKLPCDLDSVLRALKPFKKRLEKIAVESTYNWYWLVDGLQDHGYAVVLANPAAMQQYDGLKQADDKSDGFFLAEMLRLDIRPTVQSQPRQQAPQTMPGVGNILGLTITLETVDPRRFASPGQYASYCRCVDSRRLSNGKQKGENNGKRSEEHT